MNKTNLRSLDLNLLVALEVLLEECHVTNSAERLNVSQSAMSHMLSRLRATFGDELLVKGPNGYEKTALALGLEAPLREALGHVRRVFTERKFDPKTYDGNFTISTMGYGESVVIPNLTELVASEAPNATVNVVHRSSEPYERDLSDGADVVFCAHFAKMKPNHQKETLFEDRYVCVMHKDHPLARQPMSLEGYLDYPHTLVCPRSGSGNPIDTYLSGKGLERRILKTGSHFLASLLALQNTHAIQAVPEKLARRISTAFELVQRDLPFSIDGFEFAQIWHTKNQNNPPHIWFRQKVAEAARADLDTANAPHAPGRPQALMAPGGAGH